MSARINSVQIESFMALSREGNFARTAEALHVTQPALTKRIQNLEQRLGVSLFMRRPTGVELTDAGRMLQRYGAVLEHQEEEILAALAGADRKDIAGFFRIVGFSSVLRSVIVPALGPLLRANPQLNCHCVKEEVHRLQDMLIAGQVDFAVSLSECERADIENIQLGTERNILIESARHHTRPNCYIDHEPRDNFTERFFLSQTGSTVPRMERAYFDEIYGLIDAVSQGVGRAVVPAHLILSEHKVRAVPGYSAYDVPVFLHFHRQPYYTRLQETVRDSLVQRCPPLLRRNRMKAGEGAGIADDSLLAAKRHRQRAQAS
jgi:DNA-binding transcriptional LysR family regulator